MKTTTAPATLPAAPLLGEHVDVDVLGLGADATLVFVVERRRRQDAVAAEELRAVTHWADLHRVSKVGAVHPDLVRAYFGQPVLGLEGELRLAGEGAFAVEEFAVCELAAALGMSEPAARGYLGQALELRDRLPRLFDAVMGGVLPAWKGRQIAEHTIPLNAAAADYVDAHLGPFTHTLGVRRILRAVEAAVLRHDPDLAAERAEAAAEKRGVWVEDHLDGTSTLNAVAGVSGVARVDGLGPRSVESVRQWLAELPPGSTIKLTPVVDLTDHLSVDAYEAPDRLRDQVTERDHDGCRFPWCGRQGPFDVDHIDPYVPPDEGGPPGQTNTANLARLCRFHHRVKTRGGWDYRRQPSGTLTWTSPLGRSYTVDEHGTLPHD